MTSLRQRMLEDMQVRRLSPFTQRAYVETVARFAQVRPPLRPVSRAPRSRADPRLPRLPGYRTRTGTELAARRRRRAPLPLSGHAAEAVVLRRRDPRAEEAAVAAGRAQPAGSRPVSRCGQAREAPRHPDRLLRRRPAHLRGYCPDRVRHRQRTDGAAHREGQGTEEPLRDAVAEAARDSAFLVEVQRPRHWIFPGERPDAPITRSAVQLACRIACRRARLGKAVTPHLLRNAST